MDYERCAHLHNELLRRGCLASGQVWPDSPPQTWWEHYSPIDEETAVKLGPFLIGFLKRAYVRSNNAKWGNFFYYIHGLCDPNEMLCDETLTNTWDQYFKIENGRFVRLYGTTWWKDDEEYGLVFDRETSKATLISYFFELRDMLKTKYCWLPLETILAGYLEMIDEGKVVGVPDSKAVHAQLQFESVTLDNGWKPPLPEPIQPWIMNLYTPIDVEKATSALERLLDAIDSRIDGIRRRPGSTAALASAPYANLLWSGPAMFRADLIPEKTFAFDFLKAVARLRVRFRYLAPGIRFMTPEEFLGQSTKASHPGGHCLRIFQVEPLSDDDDDVSDEEDESDSDGDKEEEEEEREEEEEEENNNHQKAIDPIPPNSTTDRFPERTRPGFYIQQVHPNDYHHFANECRLELPFSIGANSWARQSSGEPFGWDLFTWYPKPKDKTSELYQSGSQTGFTDLRRVQIHKVLNNWAERIEAGDWLVNEDGVMGGIGKFRQADTERHWEKYWIPLSW
ncbi:hypothetical protein BJX70DRAFT_358512 [Aspergillus crustosus]